MQNHYLTSASILPPMLFTPYSMGIIKRRIFLHGGKYYMGNLLDEFWQYDIYLKTWINIKKDDKLPLRSRFSEILVNDEWLYLIACEDTPFNDRQISIGHFDSEKNSWEFIKNLQGPQVNYNYSLDSVQSIFKYNNSLYLIVVKQRDLSSNMMLQYSLIEKSLSVVEQKEKLSKLIDRISGSVYGNKYYCFGDMITFTENNYREIHIFDLKTYIWNNNKTYADFGQYPSNRIFSSLSFNETHGFLSGGQSESQEILDDLWSIDLRTLKWHKFNIVRVLNNKKLESKIMKHKSALYDESTLFIFGGIIDNVRSYKLQMYVIETPPLYKLCLYFLMKNNIEESELKSIPLHIRQDIIQPKSDFFISEETESHIIGINHLDENFQDS